MRIFIQCVQALYEPSQSSQPGVVDSLRISDFHQWPPTFDAHWCQVQPGLRKLLLALLGFAVCLAADGFAAGQYEHVVESDSGSSEG